MYICENAKKAIEAVIKQLQCKHMAPGISNCSMRLLIPVLTYLAADRPAATRLGSS